MFFIWAFLIILGWLICGIIVTAVGEEYGQNPGVVNSFDDRVWGIMLWPLWVVIGIIWLIGLAFSHPVVGIGRLIIWGIQGVRKAIRRDR